MPFLNYKLILALLLSIFTAQGVFADNTIIIKKYKKPHKSLLDRKIIYMDMGQAPTSSSHPSSKGLSTLAAPAQTKKSQINSIQKKKFSVNKIDKKQKLSSIGKGLTKSFNRKNSSEDIASNGTYNDDDWDEYTEYRDVIMEESLGVSAKIKR